MALANLSIYYTWKNVNYLYNNKKFKIFPPTWNDELDLPDGSYSISDIQDYFEFIIKKHETLAENPPIEIYPYKIKNRIVFKVKTDTNKNYYLQKRLNYQRVEIKALIKKKMEKMHQKLESFEVFQNIVIQSITIISKHQKHYLL